MSLTGSGYCHINSDPDPHGNKIKFHILLTFLVYKCEPTPALDSLLTGSGYCHINSDLDPHKTKIKFHILLISLVYVSSNLLPQMNYTVPSFAIQFSQFFAKHTVIYYCFRTTTSQPSLPAHGDNLPCRRHPLHGKKAQVWEGVPGLHIHMARHPAAGVQEAKTRQQR